MDETAPTVVVVGASAGGVEALTTLAAGLPADLESALAGTDRLPSPWSTLCWISHDEDVERSLVPLP